MPPLRAIGLDQFTLDGEDPDLVDDNTTDRHQWNGPYIAHAIPASIEEQCALREYDSWSGPDVCLNEQLQQAFNNCDVYFSSLHQLTSPYTAHAMTDPASISVSMDQWSRNGHSTKQLFSVQLAPVVSQPDHVPIQGIALPDIAFQPVMPHVLPLHYSCNAAYGEQRDNQLCNTEAMIVEVRDSVPRIGSVLSNGKFVCDAKGCGSKTFARRAELSRHYTTLHSGNKPNFWCQVPTCRRSMIGGGKTFHRRDKWIAHVQSVHPNVQQMCT